MSSPAAFTMSSPEPLPPLDPQERCISTGDKDERNGGSKLSGVEGNKLTARLVRFRVGRDLHDAPVPSAGLWLNSRRRSAHGPPRAAILRAPRPVTDLASPARHRSLAAIGLVRLFTTTPKPLR
ncbi:hypothetical protein A1Q2_08062 [Trichosporon asahii var. asahii CBS 8904]|uniref:Uncharacterized protein n=1 Tax=Trichosporon asahii var. asahii (strain CBS 8904) TaxID=1220162 RepID=K1W7G7_TRIAC|nr:hypothetical protein A1Q2_08062 [Trichosporon asahii var. asahii CBS 8904]